MRAAAAPIAVVVSALILCAAIAAPASAQNRSGATHTPPNPAWVDFGLGIILETPQDVNQSPTCAALRVPCLSPRTVPNGGVAANVGVRLPGSIEFVGEASLLRNTWWRYGTPCPPTGGAVAVSCAQIATNDVRGALGGLRFGPIEHGGGMYPDIQLFVQVLGGKIWSNAAPSRFALQPGGGIDLAFDSNVRLRFEVDYVFASGDVRDYSTSRVAAWVVMPLTR